MLQLNETLFFVISMVQTIGAIHMFKNLLKLQFHNVAVITRWHSLVLFLVQTVKLHEHLFAEIVKTRKKVLPDRGSCLMWLGFLFLFYCNFLVVGPVTAETEILARYLNLAFPYIFSVHCPQAEKKKQSAD